VHLAHEYFYGNSECVLYCKDNLVRKEFAVFFPLDVGNQSHRFWDASVVKIELMYTKVIRIVFMRK